MDDGRPGADPLEANESLSSPAVPAGGSTPVHCPKHVVGIGASAGGLEALELFFKEVPPDSGMAYVVVQHLSPDFKSLMDELLAHRTRIPIHRVEDGMPVVADAIYLIPPKKEMIISGGKLLLKDKDPQQGLTLPIDLFFRSLAQDVGSDAVAIVLSGTGSDGSRGIRAIHEAGGLVIAQKEETAKFDGMPKSAKNTGVVDLFLPPEQMPGALLRHVKHPLAESLSDQIETPDVAETGMSRLFHVLREEYGIDFSHYKPSTVGRRIERRLLMNQINDLDEYINRVAGDPQELNSLYRDLLIGVTKFFRDREAFERLAADVIPDLLMKTRPEEEFRVWVAGCATGEEAYSLAILIHEQLEALKRPIDVKIFATDVHRNSIDFASAGVYPESSVSEVAPRRLERYFTRKGNDYQVKADLRQMIVFACHNVIRDAPFTKLDLISCRNLLIYFQPAAQKKALSLFHFGLATGGVLLLGPSESPSELGDEFDALDPHWKIYRKRRDIRLPNDLRLPISTGTPNLRPSALAAPTTSLRGRDARPTGIFADLLDEYMPSALLVDERRELVHIFGGAEKYLRFKGGRMSVDVLDLVEDDLRVALAGAFNRVAKDQTPVFLNGVSAKTAEGETRLVLSVRPIHSRHTSETYLFVTLQESERPALPSVTARRATESDVDIDEASRDRLKEVETELQHTKENLQSTVEELETSNEELQATNEELVASNEELQSTNEELHSVNEELYTVNAEYQRKISELTQLNNDIDNLLRSTEIGTIFLGADLCIRKFTPQIARTFSLLPQDVGRRIDTFTHNIDEPDLVARVTHVIQTGESFEREVRDRQGSWYYLRILPYHADSAEIDGVVLTLIDVSTLKSTQAKLRELNQQLTSILDNSTTFIYVKDLAGRYQLCNRAGESVLGAPPESVRGCTDHDFLSTEVADMIQAHDRDVATRGRPAEYEEVIPGPNGPQTYLSVKFPLRDAASKIYAVGAVTTNITQLKHNEQEQRQAVARRDQFLAMLSHELRNPLAAILSALRVVDRDPSQESRARIWQIIDRQAHHMSRLLDDLLDVSRFTQDKIKLRTQVCDLRQTAQNAIDAIEGLLAHRNQQLSVDLPEEPVYVEGDPVRLQQIQVNLLTNASKYNSDGGKIWLTVRRRRNHAVLTVRDNGVGISDEMKDRVFELFAQSRETIDRADGGIGVGLTLVRNIVEKHGGHVAAHSDGKGKGSQFVVTLPLTSKRPVKGRRRGGKQADKCGFKVLIVEDNEDARQTLAALLELDGYQVTVAEDGTAGLEAIERDRPDMALIDIGLPEVDGFEVARRVRTDAKNDRILLVALTGYGQSEDKSAALDAGFDVHLVKPVNADKLARLLADHARATR